MGTVAKTHLHQTLDSMKLLNHTDKFFLKTITQDDHCKYKSWNAYGVSTMRSSNKEYNNKARLDQTWTITINSDHNDYSHNEWTFGHAS